MLFDPVAKLARRVYAQFTTELLAQQINLAIDSNDKKPFRLHSDRLLVELTANKCAVRDEKRLEITDDVTITERQLQSNRPARTLRCQKAFLNIEGDELAPTLTLDIRNAKWPTDQSTENLLARYVINGLVLPQEVTDTFKTDDVLNEISPKAISAALHAGPGRKTAKTLAEIASETHSRLVFGLGCITLILTGIGLGIILKGGHLLTAFAASAVPALALVACIMMGKNIAENLGAKSLSGISLMWTSLIILSALMVLMYRRMLKH
jgi:hypothetical protein